MPRQTKRRAPDRETPADAQFRAGHQLFMQHPLFGRLAPRILRAEKLPYPREGWASVSATGTLYVHPTRLAAPEEWLFLLAHCVLHLCFGHFRPPGSLTAAAARAWNVACDCVCSHFLHTLKIGRAPAAFGDLRLLPAWPEERWVESFGTHGIAAPWQHLSTAGAFYNAMIPE